MSSAGNIPRGQGGRIWLLTGAGSGFGRAMVATAVAAGDEVIATARRPETVADLVTAHPEQVETAALDVTDTSRCQQVVDEVVDRYGRLDVLVTTLDTARSARWRRPATPSCGYCSTCTSTVQLR